MLRPLLGLVATLTLALGCEPSSPADDAAQTEADVEQLAPTAPLSEGLEHRITSYLAQYGRHWPTFRFHGAVLVARGDDIGIDKAFGNADLILQLPNETDTLFRLGTLSAQLTAAATVRLAEAGVLELSDPVSRHIPGWPAGDSTTIEHLLTHRSGISNYTDDLMFRQWKKGPRRIADTLQLFRSQPLEFEPGTDTSPSNSNYVLLGAILERVADKPYAEVVAEQVLAPLHMEHTHYATTAESQAIGMTYNEEDFLEVVSDVHPSAFGPAGGWLSTTGDVLRLVRGLESEAFITPRNAKHMQGLLDEGLGYGWAASEVGSRTVVSWPGLIDGFNSAVLHVPQDGTTIIVLANSEVIAAGDLVNDIATIIYDDELPRREELQAAPVPIAEQLPAVGRYVLTRGTEEALAAAVPDAVGTLDQVSIRNAGDYLVFEVPDHGNKRMHPQGQGRYFFKDGLRSTAEVVLRPDRSALLVLESGGVKLRFIRVSETVEEPGALPRPLSTG